MHLVCENAVQSNAISEDSHLCNELIFDEEG
ncbi:hypothetical protein RCH08_001718 [Janthinobacterium sp. CG_S6]|nr:hypothetical protein [Janthinobacterium sp. CG_S6]